MSDDNTDYMTEVLSLLDPELQKKISERIAQGWQPVPGTHPVGIYYWQRNVMGVRLSMQIDEAGITVIKGNGRAT
jgi:hypothetical protein